MLDMVMMYVDVPGSKHRVDPVRKVSEKTHSDDVAGINLRPAATNADNEKDPKVSDTSAKASQSL